MMQHMQAHMLSVSTAGEIQFINYSSAFYLRLGSTNTSNVLHILLADSIYDD